MAQTNPSVTQPGPDHANAAGNNNPMCFAQFRSGKRIIPPVKKSNVLLLCNLKPASVDPERPFSIGGIAKTRVQGRLTPSNHDRNVFLIITSIFE